MYTVHAAAGTVQAIACAIHHDYVPQPIGYQEKPVAGCAGDEAGGFIAQYPLVISAKRSDQGIEDQAEIDPGRVVQRLT